MAVEFKTKKATKEVVGRPIIFNAENMMAVKMVDGTFGSGKVKIVHKILGEKLIGLKRATEVKEELVDGETTRSVKVLK